MLHLDRHLLRARDLQRDVLALDAEPLAQRQHDGADHRDEKHEAGGLEEEEILGVEHAPEAAVFATWSAGGIVDGGRADEAGVDRPGADDQHELDQEDHPDQRADRQVLQEALAQLGEVDVEHHDDEEEQHRDRADIDDDQDHRQELGARAAGTARPR